MRVKMAQRMIWMSVVVLMMLGSLGYRLFTLQIQQHEKLSKQAYLQRTQQLPLQMRRGQILDRNGTPLTAPESSFGVAVFPKLLPEPAELSQALEPLLGAMRVALLLEQARTGPEPVWVLEGLSRQAAAEVASLGLPGIGAGPVGRRYGAESLARHLVGYANEQGGQLGLEQAFERELTGDRVPMLVARLDGREQPLFGGRVTPFLPETGKEPYDLVTTIDSRIQAMVEQVLNETAHPTGGPLRGAVVVMDPYSGEVLALASRPNYIQTQLPRGDDGALVNRALQAYEPGSVFKAIVAAAALEEGVTSLDEEFRCDGHYELGDIVFGEPGDGHGRITFREAIGQSCNITLIKVGLERLGREQLLEAAQDFGLGAPTGLYPGAQESAGHLPALKYGGDTAQFSFGQAGLQATPLQIARAFSALANGGVLPSVSLVTAVKKPDGEVVARPEAGTAQRVVRTATARGVQEALLRTTDPNGQGTGRRAWVDGVGSAGKTGSAETGSEVHAWFAGWVPVEKPAYVITVYLEDGKAGGQYAAPIFRRVAEGILGLQ